MLMRDSEQGKFEDFMMPAACFKARSVDIHNNGHDIVYGFKFYDVNDSCIFSIGYTTWGDKQTVLIGASEHIIGIKCRVTKTGYYNDF